MPKKEDLYEANAADWLRRWDEGKTVWSIEMGGLGPGYEQAIQIAVAEVLRHMLEKKYNHSKWGDGKTWKSDIDQINEIMLNNPIVNNLGLSGAQFGAAVSLASHLYRKGPRKLMEDPDLKDRKIQISKNFPQG